MIDDGLPCANTDCLTCKGSGWVPVNPNNFGYGWTFCSCIGEIRIKLDPLTPVPDNDDTVKLVNLGDKKSREDKQRAQEILDSYRDPRDVETQLDISEQN